LTVVRVVFIGLLSVASVLGGTELITGAVSSSFFCSGNDFSAEGCIGGVASPDFLSARFSLSVSTLIFFLMPRLGGWLVAY